MLSQTTRLATLAVALLAGSALTPARAALTLENPGSISYQQTLNSPCVIGDNSCKQPAGFGETLIPGGPSAFYDLTSPTYTVTQLLGITGGSTGFTIGIDVNTTTQPLATERLDYFAMLINGVASAANTYDPTTPGTQLVTQANGNGYSDELLTGFSLAGLSGGTLISFRAIVNTPTDGAEEFFIVGANPTRAPEPASLALMGLGLTAMGVIKRRRKNTAV